MLAAIVRKDDFLKLSLLWETAIVNPLFKQKESPEILGPVKSPP